MKKIVMLLFVFVCSMQTAFAVRVTALYQGVVPAMSQSASERNQLATEALSQVLVKVSGNHDILNQPQIKASLSKANDLIQEFSYISAPNLPGKTTPYLLQLDFDVE